MKNAKAMAVAIMARGYKLVSNGTKNHMFLVDLIDKDITGKDAEVALGRANITVNKNTVRMSQGHRLLRVVCALEHRQQRRVVLKKRKWSY